MNTDPLKPLLNAVNRGQNTNYDHLMIQKKEAENAIAYYRRYVKKSQDDLDSIKEKIKTIAIHDFGMTRLIESLKMIKKNENIDWAFISDKMELIVQTKMLYQYDALKRKQYKEPVGRYAFKMPLTRNIDTDTLEVHPLDFTAEGKRHPNQTGYPRCCWGGSQYEVNNFIKSGNFYSAIEELIVFFSTFPHAGGHKPQWWLFWLNNREVDFQQNPWIDHKPVFTIGKITIPKKLAIKIKRKETMIINGYEYAAIGAIGAHY